MEELVRAKIGDYIYSTTPEEAIETVLMQLLTEANAQLVLLETVTDGVIAQRLLSSAGPDVPSSVHSADKLSPTLRPLLESPPGSDVARQLAQQLRTDFEAVAGESGLTPRIPHAVSYGLAVITSGRPDETFHSNQGGETWIGCAGPHRTEVVRFPFGGADRLTNAWVGNRAMDLLRRILLDLAV